MTGHETERVQRLQALMKEVGLNALVCRLPENVVYLTETWPHHGISVAVLPDGRPPNTCSFLRWKWNGAIRIGRMSCLSAGHC